MSSEEYILSIQGLKKAFNIDGMLIHALRGIDLNIKRGEFLSITGPSGSGKTTLLNCIGLLLKPTEGKILYYGNDVSKWNDDERANFRLNKIGFVFQFYNLIPELTVLENIILPMMIRGKLNVRRAKQLLKTVNLEGYEDRYPRELSGGEQQRVAIARALANNPEIILADEPTGNLDSENSRKIIELLKRLNQELNKTIILVTHEKELARYANRIVYLLDGKIQRVDTL